MRPSHKAQSAHGGFLHHVGDERGMKRGFLEDKHAFRADAAATFLQQGEIVTQSVNAYDKTRHQDSCER